MGLETATSHFEIPTWACNHNLAVLIEERFVDGNLIPCRNPALTCIYIEIYSYSSYTHRVLLVRIIPLCVYKVMQDF